MHMKVVPKLDTDNYLIRTIRFITRRGKSSTTISENGTNIVDAEQEFGEYVAA